MKKFDFDLSLAVQACFDIESLPNPKLPPQCIPTLNEDEVKYGNTKDAFKRKEILDNARAAFEAKLCKRLSTDLDTCIVACFVGKVYDEEMNILHTLSVDAREDEYPVILEGVTWILEAFNRIPIVTFGGDFFDIPVMRRRAMAMDVPFPLAKYELLVARYNNSIHWDLWRHLVGIHNAMKPVAGKNLDYYLKLFGIGAAKTGDGSMVAPWWNAGEYDKVRDYCEADVDATANLFDRVRGWVKGD